MMSLEGPFLAAVIARLADPKFNLAAHGVAFAFALLVEAPVIMIMSASTALVDNATNFNRLRKFAYSLSGAVTGVMLLILVPPIYAFLMEDVIALPQEVASLTYGALWILLPWPGAIGYRRFYQGLLIREGRTQLVAYGTVLRLATMATTAVVLYVVLAPPGVYVGAAALAVGVSVEALASRWMAHNSVRKLRALLQPDADTSPTLSHGQIARFYYPLALTSLIGLAAQPMLTFFMGRSPAPVESLAVFPVVAALSFVFRSMGLSYQEVAIALMGQRYEHVRELGRFAAGLGIVSSVGLAVVAFTPLVRVWYETVSGLSTELTHYAILPTMTLVPIPLLAVVLSYQRGILVVGRVTRPITWATIIEVTTIAVGFPVLSWRVGMVGVSAAMVTFLVGRLAGNLFLVRPCMHLVRQHGGSWSRVSKPIERDVRVEDSGPPT